VPEILFLSVLIFPFDIWRGTVCKNPPPPPPPPPNEDKILRSSNPALIATVESALKLAVQFSNG
jgi:hypothetical protein